ncbi:MAG: hypothetical protein JST87_13560 [Bacteroidetes bacterium]|nr:hypothetical protein [Bacteroidota bacterium]
MKKVILIASMLLAFAGFSFAQTTTPAKPATTHTKKDGTPDKRYKENKTSATPATTHMKKDGTPDKRYKENKTPAKKG